MRWIKGENDQKLTQYLTHLEATMTTSDFYCKLLADQKLDPENFTVASINTPEGSYAVIFGQHSYKRGAERINMPRNQVINETTRILSNPILSSFIIQFPIQWDDETENAVPAGKDGKTMSVAVMDELSGRIFVFECGYTYIRLNTVWLPKSEKFVVQHNAIAVRLNINGTIEQREECIKEFCRRWSDRYIL